MSPVISVDEVVRHAYAAGFRDAALDIIVAIAGAESGWDTTAEGDINLTVTGEVSVGLWQINWRPAYAGEPHRDKVKNKDPAYAARSAWVISGGGTRFSDWSVYTQPPKRYLQFLDRAREARLRMGQNPAGGPATAAAGPRPLPPPGVPIKLPPSQSLLAERNMLKDLRINGAAISVGVQEAVVGTPTFDLSLGQVSQLEFSVQDPHFDLLRSGLLAAGTPVAYADLDFEVASIETGGEGAPVVAIEARPRAVQFLRSERGTDIQADVSPTDYAVAAGTRGGFDGTVAEPTAKRPHIARTAEQDEEYIKRNPSTWDVLSDLATEYGYSLFEARRILFFGRPSWLIQRAGVTTHIVRYPVRLEPNEMEPLAVPVCRRSVDGDPPVEVTIKLARGDAEVIRPGDALWLIGVPTFDGTYLVTNVPLALSDEPVEIKAAVPVDPDPVERDVIEELYTLDEGVAFPDEDSAEEPQRAPHVGEAEFMWPTMGNISSPFGWRASTGTQHNGVDIGRSGANLNYGKPVYASADGRITRRDRSNSGYGDVIYMSHDGGLQLKTPNKETRYAHLLRFGPQKVGDQVKQGDYIGYVGGKPGEAGAGNSQAPHLHFEIRINGNPVNPRDIIPGNPTPVPNGPLHSDAGPAN